MNYTQQQLEELEPTIAFTEDDDDGNQSDWWNPTATAYGPKGSALLSMICSYVVIREVLKDKESRHASKVIGHVLISMSISDIVYSLAWFLSTWLTPSGDEYWYIHQNIGTTGSCTFQGFLYQFGFVASPLFNVNLAIYYLLIVKHNYTEQRLSTLEKWVQTSIWMFTLAASIYPIPMGLYNNNWEFCWFDSYPPDCKDSWTYGKDEADCIRGDNAWIHGLFFLVFPSWVCLLVVLVTFLILLRTVRNAEKRIGRYSMSTRQLNNNSVVVNRKKSSVVAERAMMYAVSFLFTYSLALVTSVRWYTTGKYNTVFDFCSYFLLPLQGFFNFIVFAWSRSTMKTREGWLLQRICFCCGSSNRKTQRRQNGSSAPDDSQPSRFFFPSAFFGSSLGRQSRPSSLFDKKNSNAGSSLDLIDEGRSEEMCNSRGGVRKIEEKANPDFDNVSEQKFHQDQPCSKGCSSLASSPLEDVEDIGIQEIPERRNQQHQHDDGTDRTTEEAPSSQSNEDEQQDLGY